MPPLVTPSKSIYQRLFRRPITDRLLDRCEIDHRQYWLLVDLLETLSERNEAVRMGSTKISMAKQILFMALMSSALSIPLVAVDVPSWLYLTVFIGVTWLLLTVILLPELTASVLNPNEATVLASQPVDGRVLLSAKLTHLIQIVAYLVASMNLIPAILGNFLAASDNAIFLNYTATHMFLALGSGGILSLFCCSLFGWLIRILPLQRLQSAATFVQVIPLIIMLLVHLYSKDIVEYSLEASDSGDMNPPTMLWEAVFAWMPRGLSVILGVAFVAVAVLLVVYGLRSLSTKQVVRFANQNRRRSAPQGHRFKRTTFGMWIARSVGGQSGCAGFRFVRSMMFRDWQSWRYLLSVGFYPIIVVIVMAWRYEVQSPFSSDFQSVPIHYVPHAIGWFTISACRIITLGADYKGISALYSMPNSFARQFSIGVFMSLYSLFSIFLNVVAIAVISWSWILQDAIVFFLLSVAIDSLYFSIGILFIDGIPFGKKIDPDRISLPLVVGFGILLGGMALAGIQSWVLRSSMTVIPVTLILGIVATLVARSAVSDFASRMSEHLELAASGLLDRLGGGLLDLRK